MQILEHKAALQLQVTSKALKGARAKELLAQHKVAAGAAKLQEVWRQLLPLLVPFPHCSCPGVAGATSKNRFPVYPTFKEKGIVYAFHRYDLVGGGWAR